MKVGDLVGWKHTWGNLAKERILAARMDVGLIVKTYKTMEEERFEVLWRSGKKERYSEKLLKVIS